MNNTHITKEEDEGEETKEKENPWTIFLFLNSPNAALVCLFYYLDVGMDILSTMNLRRAQQFWWFIISSLAIVIPELGVGIHIAIRLYKDNVKTMAKRNANGGNANAIEEGSNQSNTGERNDLRIFGIREKELSGAGAKVFAVLLFLVTPLMVLPFIVLLYVTYKYYKALKKKSQNDIEFAEKILHELMKISAIEVLFQAMPQLCLNSYIVIHNTHCSQLYEMNATDIPHCWDVQDAENADYLVTFVSSVMSLTSLSFTLSGFDYVKRVQWLRRAGFFCAFFFTICARIVVNGVMGSRYEGLWFAPPAVACLIAFLGRIITRKLSKSKNPEPDLKIDLLYHILFGGLLLAMPTIYGILVCLSYIGWAIWFFIESEVDIRYEALALAIVMQSLAMAFVSILGRPFPLEVMFFKRNRSNKTNNDNETEEVEEDEKNEVKGVYTINTDITNS